MQIRDLAIIAAALVVYAVLRRLYFTVCRLEPRAYFQPCVVAAGITGPGGWRFSLLAVATILPASVLAPHLSWAALDDGGLLRMVVGIAAGLLAWTNAGCDFNAYYGRRHLVDRALIVLTGALVLAHPVFVPAFLMVLMPFWRQVTHPPVIGEAITDKLLVVDLVIAFAAFVQVWAALLLMPAAIGVQTYHFMVLAMGLVSMHYFFPGWAKVRLGRPWTWVMKNRLSDLVMNAWVHGHAGFLPRRVAARIVRFMRPLDIPMQAATLAIELAALILLADQRLAVAVLGALVLMHIGIILASGIAFWKWAIVGSAMIVFLLSAGPATLMPLFSTEALACGVAVALLGRWHSTPAMLGWFDSRLVQFFRYEIIDEHGRIHALPNTFFAPYDQAFCQGRLAFLCDEPFLVATHGNIRPRESGPSAGVIRALIERSEGDPSRIARLCRRYGAVRKDEAQAERFDRFIRRSFDNLSRHRRKTTIFGLLWHPKHFWHWNNTDAAAQAQVYHMGIAPAAFRVRFLEIFTEPSRFTILTDRIVREVSLAQPGVIGQIAPAATAEPRPARRMAEARAG